MPPPLLPRCPGCTRDALGLPRCVCCPGAWRRHWRRRGAAAARRACRSWPAVEVYHRPEQAATAAECARRQPPRVGGARVWCACVTPLSGGLRQAASRASVGRPRSDDRSKRDQHRWEPPAAPRRPQRPGWPGGHWFSPAWAASMTRAQPCPSGTPGSSLVLRFRGVAPASHVCT